MVTGCNELRSVKPTILWEVVLYTLCLLVITECKALRIVNEANHTD